jgi:hypothetical protein
VCCIWNRSDVFRYKRLLYSQLYIRLVFWDIEGFRFVTFCTQFCRFIKFALFLDLIQTCVKIHLAANARGGEKTLTVLLRTAFSRTSIKRLLYDSNAT